MTEYLQLLANLLGVSSSVVTTVLLLCVAITLSIGVYISTRSLLLSLLISSGVFIFGAITGLLPLWLSLLGGFLGFSLVLFTRFYEVGDDSIDIKLTENPRDLILRIEKASRRWPQYINNLDNLLGIVTINDENTSNEYGLRLSEQKELYIHPGYDWYITDKHPSQDLFKVVGLHKDGSLTCLGYTKHLVYLLGKNPASRELLLIGVPGRYLEGDLEECLLWTKRGGYNLGF